MLRTLAKRWYLCKKILKVSTVYLGGWHNFGIGKRGGEAIAPSELWPRDRINVLYLYCHKASVAYCDRLPLKNSHNPLNMRSFEIA